MALYVRYNYDRIIGYSFGNLHEVELKNYTEKKYSDWPISWRIQKEDVLECADDELFVIVAAHSGRRGSAYPTDMKDCESGCFVGPKWHHIVDNTGETRAEMHAGFLLKPGQIAGVLCSAETKRSSSHSHVWVGWDGHQATVLEWPKTPPKNISEWTPEELVKLHIRDTLQVDLNYYQRKSEHHPEYYQEKVESTRKAITALQSADVVLKLNIHIFRT